MIHHLAPLVIEVGVDDIRIARAGVAGGLGDEPMTIKSKIVGRCIGRAVSSNLAHRQAESEIGLRETAVNDNIGGVAIDREIGADGSGSRIMNNLLRQEIEHRVIDDHRAVPGVVGHLQRQTVRVVNGGVGGRLRRDAVAGKITRHDGVGHVPVGVIPELSHQAALVCPRGYAARIIAGRGGVGGEPNLLNGLAQRVGDFGDESVGVVVSVGAVVPVNDQRVAGNCVREGIGDVKIVRVNKSRRANGVQVHPGRGQLVGDPALAVIGIDQLAPVRFILLNKQVCRVSCRAASHRLRGVLILIGAGGTVR